MSYRPGTTPVLRGPCRHTLKPIAARSCRSYLERTTARMSTETVLMPAQKRRGFKLSARPRPALASITAGAGFTAADLAASPMPVVGQLAGKAATEEKKKMTFGDVMKKASARAFRGGAAVSPPASCRWVLVWTRSVSPTVQPPRGPPPSSVLCARSARTRDALWPRRGTRGRPSRPCTPQPSMSTPRETHPVHAPRRARRRASTAIASPDNQTPLGNRRASRRRPD